MKFSGLSGGVPGWRVGRPAGGGGAGCPVVRGCASSQWPERSLRAAGALFRPTRADEGAVTEIKGAPPGRSGAGVGPANGTHLKDSAAPFLLLMFPPLSCAHAAIRVCVCVCLCHSRRVRLFVTAWTVARQAPLSTGFSRQEHWGGWPRLLRGSSRPRLKPASVVSRTGRRAFCHECHLGCVCEKLCVCVCMRATWEASVCV